MGEFLIIGNNMSCPRNRIKPKLLREMKTEAILVFVRTTLEESFKQIETNGYQFSFNKEEDNEFVYGALKSLLLNLQECVVNSTYIRSLIANAHKNPTLKMVCKKEEPLITYYDSIIKTLETNLANGEKWIPELVVLCIISEWILEEEKSVYLYPFLEHLDYIELISKYDLIKKEVDDEKKEIISNMYILSSKIITKLKNTKYKVQQNKRKKRK